MMVCGAAQRGVSEVTEGNKSGVSGMGIASKAALFNAPAVYQLRWRQSLWNLALLVIALESTSNAQDNGIVIAKPTVGASRMTYTKRRYHRRAADRRKQKALWAGGMVILSIAVRAVVTAILEFMTSHGSNISQLAKIFGVGK